jgi:hypothetical protein
MSGVAGGRATASEAAVAGADEAVASSCFLSHMAQAWAEAVLSIEQRSHIQH